MAWGRSQVAKSRSRTKYPKNWNTIASKVNARDGDCCFFCGRSRETLQRLTKQDGKKRDLETHHLFSVRTGNNRKTNLVKCCSPCHSKQPKHGHLKNR